MTIYRRLKENGVNVAELRDADTGELTAAGASIIASMFPNAGVTDGKTDPSQDATDVVQRDDTDHNGQVTGDGSTVAAVLQAKLDGANALIQQLTDERDELRRQLATVTAALEREQTDRQQERLMLTASSAATSNDDGQVRRAGWWRRLFHG